MKKFATMSAAAFFAFGGVSSLTVPAHAQDLELELGQSGPKLRLRDDCDPEVERCRDDNRRGIRDDNRDSNRTERRGCTEDRALDKAERMGIRRARVVSAGRRVIEIRGRDRDGERIQLTMGRDRNCPIIG